MDKRFFVSYPAIKHPLANEKTELKMKYLCLIEYFRMQICPEDVIVQARVERFKKDFLAEDGCNNQYVEVAMKEIMKTRFTPFRFFSYRYVFLFDCVYLLSIDSFEYAEQIGNLLKGNLNQRYHKKIDFIIEKMCANPLELSVIPLITNEMIKSLIKAQGFIKSEIKSVVFTATMSAGKSTLINAIVGHELSYTKKAACTATIMEFYSSPVYYPRYNVYDVNGEKMNLTYQEVRKISEGRIIPLNVSGYFNSRISAKKFRLVDTPGVNSFLNPAHKQITRDELLNGEHDAIVYVIPVENYGSEDDYIHLSFIRKKVKYKNIVFVVNMMDSCDFEDDSVEEIIDNITKHLIEIGYSEPVVCPLSAKAGLLFKKALSYAELTPNDIRELNAFINKYEDEVYDLSPCYNVTGNDDFCNEEFPCTELNYERLQELYLKTGLPQFESILLNMK